MTLKDVNWNQVYYFFEVARKLSMKDAAQSTGVSLPTVSEQIKRLETSLNVVLFKRFPRRIELTSEGESLFQYSKEMFDTGLRFVDAISNTNNIYSARVGIQESVVGGVEYPFLERYFDQFNSHGMVHTVRENDSVKLLERLSKGEFDWALSFEPNPSFRMNSSEVGRSEVVFACAKHLAEGMNQPLDLLRTLPLARTSWDVVFNRLIEARLAAADIVPRDIFEIDQPELCLSLVSKGKCTTALLKSDLSRYPQLKSFTLPEPIEVGCFAVWRKANERLTSIKVLNAALTKPTSQRQPPDVESLRGI